MSDDTAEVIRSPGGRPCNMIHYFYCADGGTAARLVQRLHGWIVSVFPPGNEITRWEVHAVQLDVILTQAVVTATGDQFLALAGEFGAEYGGWKCEQP